MHGISYTYYFFRELSFITGRGGRLFVGGGPEFFGVVKGGDQNFSSGSKGGDQNFFRVKEGGTKIFSQKFFGAFAAVPS